MNGERTLATIQNNKNLFLLIAIIILAGSMLYYVFFINTDIISFLNKKQSTQQPSNDYPTLDTPLNRVVNSSTPKTTAEKAGLIVIGDGVATVILLKEADFSFTDTLGTQQSRYGKTIQAIVKFTKLKTLAQNNRIESIRAITKAEIELVKKAQQASLTASPPRLATPSSTPR